MKLDKNSTGTILLVWAIGIILFVLLYLLTPAVWLRVAEGTARLPPTAISPIIFTVGSNP